MGHYINADEIANILKENGKIDLFEKYGLHIGSVDLSTFAMKSGLVRGRFSTAVIKSGHIWDGPIFRLNDVSYAEPFAQLLVAFLCDLMIRRRLRFSFETVFSHPSKIELMKRARRNGYKVYLYFIATNSVEINKDRVRTRVLQKGHDVPPEKIEERYEKALGQVLPAIRECYHAFIFDNSGFEPVMFAEMKELTSTGTWSWKFAEIPDWFIRRFLIASQDPLYLEVARKALASR